MRFIIFLVICQTRLSARSNGLSYTYRRALSSAQTASHSCRARIDRPARRDRALRVDFGAHHRVLGGAAHGVGMVPQLRPPRNRSFDDALAGIGVTRLLFFRTAETFGSRMRFSSHDLKAHRAIEQHYRAHVRMQISGMRSVCRRVGALVRDPHGQLPLSSSAFQAGFLDQFGERIERRWIGEPTDTLDVRVMIS